MDHPHPVDALPQRTHGYFSVRKLHDRAMAILDPVIIRKLKQERDPDADRAAYALALIPEIVAAHRLATVRKNEPSRSILYRSAASIAYCAGAFAVARALCDCARDNHPHVPVEILAELEELERLILLAEIGAC